MIIFNLKLLFLLNYIINQFSYLFLSCYYFTIASFIIDHFNIKHSINFLFLFKLHYLTHYPKINFIFIPKTIIIFI